MAKRDEPQSNGAFTLVEDTPGDYRIMRAGKEVGSATEYWAPLREGVPPHAEGFTLVIPSLSIEERCPGPKSSVEKRIADLLVS